MALRFFREPGPSREFILLALLALGHARPVVSDSEDPMATVRQYVDAFNNGDEKAMAAACADPMQILDGMSPHVWQGPTAAEDWYADALAEGEHLGVTDYHIELGEPLHVDVTGDYSYVVIPATFDYNRQGNPVNQTGASFTLALRRWTGTGTGG